LGVGLVLALVLLMGALDYLIFTNIDQLSKPLIPRWCDNFRSCARFDTNRDCCSIDSHRSHFARHHKVHLGCPVCPNAVTGTNWQFRAQWTFLFPTH
jgi:hypothetical protein